MGSTLCDFDSELDAAAFRGCGASRMRSAAIRADADDLTQMTIERALRRAPAVAAGDPARYLALPDHAQPVDRHGPRARAARRRWKRRRRKRPTVGERPARRASRPAIELKRVMAAMDRLPDEQREVVALILIEGFGYREAAEMLGLPIGTVSSRLVRGRTALLEMVGDAMIERREILCLARRRA